MKRGMIPTSLAIGAAATSHIPDNPREWCEINSARYGVTVDLPINKTSVVSSVIIDIIGVPERTVKAILAGCLVGVVELCIILFSFLANGKKEEGSGPVAEKSEAVAENGGPVADKLKGMRPGKKEDFLYYCDRHKVGTNNAKVYNGHCSKDAREDKEIKKKEEK